MLYDAPEWAAWKAELAAGNVAACPPAKGVKLFAAATLPEVKQEEGLRQVRFILSTADVDRDRDTIAVEGWDLTHYQNNPVVLWAHRYSEPPIARAVQIVKSSTALAALDEFPAEGVYPFADLIYGLVRDGFLRTCSVGFRPQTWVYNQERGGVDFQTQELLEQCSAS